MATKNKMIRTRLDDETRERLLNIVVKYGFRISGTKIACCKFNSK